jgi:hypothetical protein
MIAAVIVAVGIMFIASGPVARFVSEHPTTKMLALAFLLLIGTSLVADGFGFHIEKGYIYAAMAFSVLVEAVNIFAKQRRLARQGTHPGGSVSHSKALASKGPESAATAAFDVPSKTKPKPRSTAASRAKARPKSAPRKRP